MVEEYKKEKIERFGMSGSGNESENDVLQDSRELEKVVTESKACPDLHKNLADLTSQVQMMSDSLVACKQMSKYRPLRKACDVAAKTKPQPTPQTSVQTFLSAEKMTQSVEKDVIISYMTNKTESLKKIQRRNGCSSEESLSGSDLRDLSNCGRHKRRFDVVSNTDFPRIPKKSSKTEMYKIGDMDPVRMADVIQRELKILVHLAPSVSPLASALSDTVTRYTGCAKCSKKISSSLPWILNRIQELIVHVAVKRQESDTNRCHWSKSSIEEVERAPEEDEKIAEKQEEETKDSDLPPVQAVTEIGKSENVDATATSVGRPGVQILLEVKPERHKKRLYHQADRRVLESQHSNYPLVQFDEPACESIIQVLKPSPRFEVCSKRIREIFYPCEYSVAFCQVFVFCSRLVISLLVFKPVTRTFSIEKARAALFLKPEERFEERALQPKKNSLTILTKKRGQPASNYSSLEKTGILPQVKSSNRKPIVQCKSSCHSSNVRKSFNLKTFLANAPDIVKDLLREAEEEKMEMKKLEVEVQGLKDLMLEVHRNQIELSRFLLEHGIYSQPLIRLTDPNMLVKENEALKKIENSILGNGNYSIESVKAEIRELKEKCILKNKTMLTLMKGLQSNVPKEWWEEIMISTLDDSKPIEEFDSEKFSELIWRISLLPLNNDEQASKKKSRTEEEPSEEQKQNSEEIEALTISDSDHESDYLTGLEDFIECSASKVEKAISSCLASDFARTSSFLQNILYEDSQSGVAVVDLFVAVKTVKDNLDFLAKCNNEVFDKINALNREVKVFKKQYGDFLGNMETFIAKMDADTRIWEIRVPKSRKVAEVKKPDDSAKVKTSEAVLQEKKDSQNSQVQPESSSESQQTQDKEVYSVAEAVSECKSCGKKITSKRWCSECSRVESSDSKNSKGNCLGCLMSTFKERSFSRLPVLSEALLSSFLASLLWLQKVRERSVTSSRSSSPALEEKKADTRLNLRDSTVEMIYDICEIVNGVAKDTHEHSDLSCSKRLWERSRSQDTSKSYQTDKSIAEFPNDVSCLYCGQNSFPKNFLKKRKSDESMKSMEDEMTSEGESEFEEALSGPLVFSNHYDLKAKPSVTCMGDLTTAVTGKKSSTVLSPTVGVMPAWIKQLSTEIISKLKKNKSKTRVRVFEGPFDDSDMNLKKLGGCVELPIRANTPMGVFDVTVVQYKKSRLLKDRLSKYRTEPLHVSCSSNPVHDCQLTGVRAAPREDLFSWSEDSLYNVDSEVVSHSGESDLEEFIEIFVGNPKHREENEKLISSLQEKGFLRAMELKGSKAHFFEIQKCCPVYFLQEVLQKISLVEEKKQLTVEKYKKEISEEKFLSLTAGEKREKQVIISGSSSDLVIYIQVEVEGNQTPNSEGLYLEYQTSSLGTQTAEDSYETISLRNEKIIKLEEEKHDGVSLYQIWKGCDKSHPTDVEAEKSEARLQIPSASIEDVERVISVKEPKEKTVTFSEELSEIFIEKEIQETYLEDEAIEGTSRGFDVRDAKQNSYIWLLQNNLEQIERGEIRTSQEVPKDVADKSEKSSLELKKALQLIHEIESDIVDVKLSDAISILPRLETELRKHLQDKMKSLGEKDSEGTSSLHNYFSAIDFWPGEESTENSSETSEDRLNNLLAMLSNLEQAVKSSEHSSNDLCQYDSSKIYKLLQALTASIRELESDPNVSSLSQTMEIASQLDTAVREYDSIVRRPPVDYVSSKGSRQSWKRDIKSLEDVSVMRHLKNVRKKVFEIVEVEATDVEGRVEKDFDRLDRLEGENDEALMFLEAFLQKTQRRVAELSNLKMELTELSLVLNSMYEGVKETIERKKEKEKEMEVVQIKVPEVQNFDADSSVDSVCVSPLRAQKEAIKETVSGLLLALDTLKSKAKEKKEVCKEILQSGNSEKVQESENSSQRSSRSSFTTKHADKLYSTIKDFKKIGESSLYLSWTKPEGPLKGSIVGYQIHVNEKLNQKVRNPQRLQAVLYSVDLTEKADVQLYAVAENNQKILLTTVSYLDRLPQ